MSGYIAFVKKEFTENIKNYRFLILFAVFLVFGIMSAFLAKFTPEILSTLAADMQMTSEPVALDAWKQFYKNISGVGFSAFIILAVIDMKASSAFSCRNSPGQPLEAVTTSNDTRSPCSIKNCAISSSFTGRKRISKHRLHTVRIKGLCAIKMNTHCPSSNSFSRLLATFGVI